MQTTESNLAKQNNKYLKVLYVEDDLPIREAIVELLADEGYEVYEAKDGIAGLLLLSEKHFDLVITDYNLPGKNGIEMISEARDLGFMESTCAMIVSGAINVPRLIGVPRLRKPLDIDDLLLKAQELLAPARERLISATQSNMNEKYENLDPAWKRRIVLVLYVNSSSSASLRAVRNLEKILQEFESSQILLTIVDVISGDTQAAEDDLIAITPTLLKRSPGATTRLLGSLDNPEALFEMLRDAGVDQKGMREAKSS